MERGEEMTNHDRFVKVFRNRSGREFETNQIELLMLKESDIEHGAIRPNDHAKGNVSACRCAGTDARIFDRVRKGLYRVR